ncbi:uncharacterized protein MELLADRAFT_91321 [Melampsora larici-populina 98AG31]|uniref:Uncharacterized protein n=1 Tax=Melampsora larici-populina (strain 98AG31 / pathotype 3-4-7) TaxID=747676 RepID=F4RYM4_MELLP|nr:uncharacterized protein MELLADRAFT_91321 [Melampsora larici-populina 98AG31]EGG02495.1 hypothetical protein MELLADRAFT_91321 [Melampsora larici-populina 98AG31]
MVKCCSLSSQQHQIVSFGFIRLEMFDPSAPGVTKQMMLDWLRINHPKSPVISSTRKSSVAEMVRKKQPEFFPNPLSDAPGVMPSSSNTLNELQTTMPDLPQSSPQPAIEAEQPVNQSDPSTSSDFAPPVLPQEVPKPPIALERKVKRSGSPASSAKPAKRATFALPPVVLPQEPLQLSIPPERERQLKRSGSPTAHKQLSKRAHLGDEGPPHFPRKPSKKETKRVGKGYPFSQSSRPSHMEPPKSTPAVHNSRIDLLGSASTEDLKALQVYELESIKPSKSLNEIPSSSKMTGINDLINHPVTPEMKDLIDLSSVDLLGVEDLAAITEDIQAHKNPASTTKSGVDVFQEERHRVEITVSTLETSVSQLMKRVEVIEETSVAKIMHHEQQRYEQGELCHLKLAEILLTLPIIFYR